VSYEWLRTHNRGIDDQALGFKTTQDDCHTHDLHRTVGMSTGRTGTRCFNRDRPLHILRCTTIPHSNLTGRRRACRTTRRRHGRPPRFLHSNVLSFNQFVEKCSTGQIEMEKPTLTEEGAYRRSVRGGVRIRCGL
jgi:hypothetical protein